MFFRLHTDGRVQVVDLAETFSGPTRTACWVIGGGPSLADLPTDAIAASPAPKFAVNLAGHGLLRPTFWTSYDPTARFQRSLYLDASILKFVHRCRAMDLVPGTTFKVCETPATYFFERDPDRGYHDFLAPGRAATPSVELPHSHQTRLSSEETRCTITDWQDSLVQAIDLAYRLGFRTLLLAGCDMFVPPSPEQIALAQTVGVTYRPREPLRDFCDRCRQAGLSADELERLPTGRQYHFEEHKPLAAAIQTDLHYFRVAQYLRLARRSMALAGLELISVTPLSRLNDYFPYRPVANVLAEIAATVGDPRTETTRGRYTGAPATPPAHLAPMRDFPPHHWSRRSKPVAPPQEAPPVPPRDDPRQRLRKALQELPEIPVDIPEQG
jgi:hypothetical protein